MARDTGLDTLLDLDGETFNLEGDYWTKIEVRRCDATAERPHGIRYSLTLHDRYGRRLFGMDNAHAVKPKRRKYGGRKIVEHDHVHDGPKDEGTHYEFESAEKLIEDFFSRVNQIIEENST